MHVDQAQGAVRWGQGCGWWGFGDEQQQYIEFTLGRGGQRVVGTVVGEVNGGGYYCISSTEAGIDKIVVGATPDRRFPVSNLHKRTPNAIAMGIVASRHY